MDIYEKLKSGHSRTITDSIVAYVGQDKKRFEALLRCFLSDEMRISQRASWALGDVTLKYPKLFEKHHRKLMDSLKAKQKHRAIRRNIVRTYQFAQIPEAFEAELYDICFNFIADPDEATAVKAFSLRVCERMVEKYPEMSNELTEVINANLELWSSGLKNRGKKFLVRWG